MITDEQFDSVSQNAHMAGGALATILGGYFAGWRGAIIASFLIVAFAAGKEYWWDKKFESTETQGSGGRDFWHYVLGVALAACAVVWREAIL